MRESTVSIVSAVQLTCSHVQQFIASRVTLYLRWRPTLGVYIYLLSTYENPGGEVGMEVSVNNIIYVCIVQAFTMTD